MTYYVESVLTVNPNTYKVLQLHTVNVTEQ